MHKGLKQRDPLAPFLFLIAAEGLRGLMENALDQKKFESMKVGTKKVEFSLLQYADDTIFVGSPSI
jgi:hypothetical protein